MGKTTASMVIAAMEPPITAIQLENAGPNDDVATISPDLVFFRGHFPGNPVLPGAIQIDRLVLPCIKARWPDLGSVRAIPRIKFRKPITPKRRLRINVNRDGERVHFRICSETDRDVVFSEGTLVLKRVGD
jgi:3-hydroxymyristoyl/3-hydroxydecanoyl-(acyl carrier protein) dehydratase